MEEKNETQVVEEKIEESAPVEESSPRINVINLEKNPDVDAFAEGYRYGYESQQDDDDDDWKGINQNENSDIENVK